MMIENIYKVKKVTSPHDIITEVSGSKSITNRALLIAALAKGKSILQGVLFSDDSRYFMKALQTLGFFIQVDEENKTVIVEGLGGEIPCVTKTIYQKATCNSKDIIQNIDNDLQNVKECCVADNHLEKQNLQIDAEIYVGSAGTAARFLTAFLGLSKGRFRMTCSEQMKKRPMKELLVALEEIGTEIIYEEEPYHFPFVIGNFYCKKETVTIDVEKSSQFLSAFLISSVLLPESFQIHVKGNHGMSYVEMTMKMMEQFGVTIATAFNGSYYRKSGISFLGQTYKIEPDISAACYFYALSPLLNVAVKVKGVHMNSLQGDIKFLKVLHRMGCSFTDREDGVIMYPPQDCLLGGSFDLSAFSDQALTLAAIAPFASSKVCIMNVGHIRYQECNRIEAIVRNLNYMGILSVCEDNNIFILPGKPLPTTIETYEDHRVAMAFSLVGVCVDGIQIKNPSCTKKTFENYFEVLEDVVY